MSIIDAFNTSEQIIDPSAVARPIEGFPDTVLVTFSQKVLEAAAKRFKLTLLKEMHCCYTVPVYAFEYKGRKFGIYMTCLGGSAATEKYLPPEQSARCSSAPAGCWTGVLPRGIL